jgi:uncharacterized protein YndB with AHSA1/START domain
MIAFDVDNERIVPTFSFPDDEETISQHVANWSAFFKIDGVLSGIEGVPSDALEKAAEIASNASGDRVASPSGAEAFSRGGVVMLARAA